MATRRKSTYPPSLVAKGQVDVAVEHKLGLAVLGRPLGGVQREGTVLRGGRVAVEEGACHTHVEEDALLPTSSASFGAGLAEFHPQVLSFAPHAHHHLALHRAVHGVFLGLPKDQVVVQPVAGPAALLLGDQGAEALALAFVPEGRGQGLHFRQLRHLACGG